MLHHESTNTILWYGMKHHGKTDWIWWNYLRRAPGLKHPYWQQHHPAGLEFCLHISSHASSQASLRNLVVQFVIRKTLCLDAANLPIMEDSFVTYMIWKANPTFHKPAQTQRCVSECQCVSLSICVWFSVSMCMCGACIYVYMCMCVCLYISVYVSVYVSLCVGVFISYAFEHLLVSYSYPHTKTHILKIRPASKFNSK